MRTLRVLLVDDHDGFINAAMRHFRKVEWLDIAGTASVLCGVTDRYVPDAENADMGRARFPPRDACLSCR